MFISSKICLTRWSSLVLNLSLAIFALRKVLSSLTFTCNSFWLTSSTIVILLHVKWSAKRKAVLIVSSVLSSFKPFTTIWLQGTLAIEGFMSNKTEQGAFLVIFLAIEPT